MKASLILLNFIEFVKQVRYYCKLVVFTFTKQSQVILKRSSLIIKVAKLDLKISNQAIIIKERINFIDYYQGNFVIIVRVIDSSVKEVIGPDFGRNHIDLSFIIEFIVVKIKRQNFTKAQIIIIILNFISNQVIQVVVDIKSKDSVVVIVKEG